MANVRYLLENGTDALLAEDGNTLRLEGTFFDDVRQNIIDGLDSAQSEGTGWDAVVKAGLAVTTVVRTSDTVVTVTLPAFATFDITAQEPITDTIPAVALATGGPLVATPTFTVAVASSFVPFPRPRGLSGGMHAMTGGMT